MTTLLPEPATRTTAARFMVRVTGVDPLSRKATLERNLSILSLTSPDAAERIRNTPCPESATFEAAGQSGAAWGSVGGRSLCSRRRPLEEAAAFGDRINPTEVIAPVILGFGVGHHVAEAAQKIGRHGVILAFDNDLPTLRAVFEHTDQTGWMTATNFVLLTDPDDGAAITTGISGSEALLGMGCKIFDHAASTPRLEGAGDRFSKTFARIASSVRTQLVTTMVQTGVSVRNGLMNLGHYASGRGVNDLRDCCAGRPGVVVAAGPSLRRNLHLLARPGVRERVAIVATQTVLKPMLDAGIRPHFVTALDHHEISARFYEGLTEADVRGITLIAEPKANPCILDSFPGAIRCLRDETLEQTLGDLGNAHEAVTPGATVAHLAYYFARHLGCDPVALIGQDLGFTDGQYYAAGASIHRVWAGELGEFRTLESMEWERIARSRDILHAATDTLGRHIYTDEQMTTYLAQFERDFRADAQRGLTVIDATEGGVRKQGASPLPLRDFLERYGGEFAEPLPEIVRLGEERAGAGDAARAAQVRRRVREVRRGVWKVGECARKAVDALTEMRDHHQDQARVNRLIEKVHALRDEAEAERPGYDLVQRINQTGAFRRARTDRQIMMDTGLDPYGAQRRTIDRDIDNVRWLIDASNEMGRLLDVAARALDGGPKLTRDAIDDRGATADLRAAARATVAAVIPVDPERGGLGNRRSLEGEAAWGGKSLLRLTLERLARCSHLHSAVLLTADIEATRALAGGEIAGLRVEYAAAPDPRGPLGARAPGVRAARLFSAEAWRGGVGGLTVYDELLCPDLTADALERAGVDAALLVGPDWCFVDPGLCDAVIERYRERPEAHRFTFTQAAPGLCGALMDAYVLRDQRDAAVSGKAGSFASLAGLVSYLPVRAKPDPIAFAVCAPVPPPVRDAGARMIIDGPAGRAALRAAAARFGDGLAAASGEEIVRAVGEIALGAREGPRRLTIEVNTERAVGGRRLAWAHGMAGGFVIEPPGAPGMPLARFAVLVAEAASLRPDLALSLDGVGDPALRGDLPALVRAAREAGAAGVHVRTDLATDASVSRLLEASPDVISVDVLAESPHTYHALTDGASHEALLRRLSALADGRPQASSDRWVASPWIVCRMTRCDAVYSEVEPFVDRWTMAFGGAVLDPMPAAAEEERIEPLPLPPLAEERERSGALSLTAAGLALRGGRGAGSREPVADAAEVGLAEAWRRVLAARGKAAAWA